MNNKLTTFNPDCNGKPFQKTEAMNWFIAAVKRFYNKSSLTTGQITTDKNLLIDFAEQVLEGFEIVNGVYGEVDRRWWLMHGVVAKDQHGYSFCDYVGKRLTILRKQGKLKAKHPRKKAKRKSSGKLPVSHVVKVE